MTTRRTGLVLLAALMAAATLSAAPGAAGEEPFTPGPPEDRSTAPHAAEGSAPVVEDEILVQFRPGVRRALGRAGVRADLAVKRFLPLDGLPRLDLVRLRGGASVEEAAAMLERDPRVAFAEPNFIHRPFEHGGLPDDPLYHDQWGPQRIAASEAWGAAVPAGDRPVIAVVDTGVDHEHPDLAANVLVNQVELAGEPGSDDDGNGCVDDVHGCNFVPQQPNGDRLLPGSAYDGFDHGTHVAGIAAADTDNEIGIAGVCPGCRIMILRVGQEIRPGGGAPYVGLPTSAIVSALDFAIREGAHIVNASWGCPCWSKALYQALRRLRTNDVLFVASAGNADQDNDIGQPGSFLPSFPATHTLGNIISVAASNDRDGYPDWSSWGRRSVDLAAPGARILSTVPQGTGDVAGDYRRMSGTSMAAPHVAGVAGLLLSQDSTLTPDALRSRIMEGAERPPTLGSLRRSNSSTRVSGWLTRTNGLLQAGAAVAASSHQGDAFSDGEIEGARWIRTRRRGYVRHPNDVNDIHKKRLRAGTRYVIRLRVPKGKDYDLLLWKRQTKELWQRKKLARSSVRFSGQNEVVRIRPGRTGVFYIQVMAWYGTRGSYTLTVRRG